MRILVFGDIVGRIGREAVKRVLPAWKQAHQPDIVIANAENLSNGRGVTVSVITDLHTAGIDLFTSGNHIWDNKEVFEIFSDAHLSPLLLRPYNLAQDIPGQGARCMTVGTKNVLVLNFLGRVFSKMLVDDPFRAFDQALRAHSHEHHVVLVDFHAEATSEKAAFGWYVDGRASAVWGTHTHVATRDERILTSGTGYITDIGMSGFNDGVVGFVREPILKNFTTQLPAHHDIPDQGSAIVNAILIKIDDSGRTSAIEHLHTLVTI